MSSTPADDRTALADARARMGMWVFLGSEIMFFGPVFFTYLYGRYEWPQAFETASRSTDLVCGALNTALLLSSSLAIAVAVLWAGRGSLRHARRAIDAAVMLGVIFLLVKGYEYAQDWHDNLVPGSHFHLQGAADQAAVQLFYFIYFFSTLLHALHLLIGIVLVLYCRSLLTHAPPRTALRRLELCGLYWHFVDIVWIFLFPALYLAGRAG